MRRLKGHALALLVLLAVVAAGCSNNDSDFVFTNPGTQPPANLAPVTPIDGQLVLAQNGQLFRVDTDGQNLAALTSGFLDDEPNVHPDGLFIVFSRLVNGQHEIVTIASDGSQATSLTGGFDFDAFSPNYSFDGTRIVFSAGISSGQQHIYIMEADGSDVRALTDGTNVDTRPSFSSDGNSVVFERAVGSFSKICRVPVAGGAVVDLTDGQHLDLHPSYCPPDDTIVFSRDGDLFRMDDHHQPDDDAGLIQVLDGLETSHPTHSPEGNYLYFLASADVAAQGGSGMQIFQARPDGSEVMQLTDGLNVKSLGGALKKKAQGAVDNKVTVQVVNDSGLADSAVFMLLATPKTSDQIVQGPPTLLTNAGGAGVNGQGVALSTLTPAAQKLKSPYTGEDRNVYSFVVRNLVSGQVNFSYNTPVSITNGAAPTSATSYRYDKMEITYEQAIKGGGGNLTSIDFYGIPLQVEVLHDGEVQPDPLQTKSFYASSPTILKTLASMSGDMASGAGWAKSVGGGTFNPQTSDFSNFARILSPNTIAAADTPQARPFPYPSFEAYMTSLVGKSFALNGAQHGGYRYTAVVQSDGAGGFNVVCTGTTTVAPAGSGDPQVPQVGKDATVTIHLPKGQAGPASNPAISMDFFIYACVANSHSYSVSGYPFSGTAAEIDKKVGYVNSTAYGSIVGDVQAALNFGYPNGKFVPPGGDIDALFGTPVVLPYPYPFGGARNTNDGFYNPYAAVLYYLSDAYGHPFSDRLDAASPLYQLAAGDTVRITILPDNRLDAPLPTVTGQTESTLSLSWPSVANATGYTVSISPEDVDTAVLAAAAGASTQSHTISGLKPGAPYLITVKATGTTNAKPVTSNALTLQGVTSGTRALVGGGPIKLETNLALPNNLSNKADLQAYINGLPVGPTANALLALNFGVNIVDLKIKSISNGQDVYRGNYFLELVSQNAGNTMFAIGPLFQLQYNLLPLSVAPPKDTYPLEGNALVIGTPFAPKPFYQFFQTVFP